MKKNLCAGAQQGDQATYEGNSSLGVLVLNERDKRAIAWLIEQVGATLCGMHVEKLLPIGSFTRPI